MESSVVGSVVLTFIVANSFPPSLFHIFWATPSVADVRFVGVAELSGCPSQISPRVSPSLEKKMLAPVFKNRYSHFYADWLTRWSNMATISVHSIGKYPKAIRNVSVCFASLSYISLCQRVKVHPSTFFIYVKFTNRQNLWLQKL